MPPNSDILSTGMNIRMGWWSLPSSKEPDCQLARSPHSSSLSPRRRQGTLCIYSHTHDQKVSLVSKHLFLPPAARCDIHEIIWHLPLAFCSMRTLALDTEQRVAYLAEASWQRKGREFKTAPHSQSSCEMNPSGRVQGQFSFLNLVGFLIGMVN